MAITKLMHMKSASGGSKSSHLKNAIDYILKKEKVAWSDNLRLAGSQACLLDAAYKNMMQTKEYFEKTDGRQGYHFVLSFRPGQAMAEQVFKLTQEFVKEYLSGYECVYAVHNDQPHMHAHIVFNSVSYETGLKYHYKNGDWEKIIQPIVDRLCVENGLPPLEYHIDEYENDIDTKEYYHYTKGFSRTKEIKADIDECINKSKDWNDFINHMKAYGYTFNIGKSVSLKKPGMGKARRLKESTVGMAYTPDGIITRIKIKNKEIKLADTVPVIQGTEKLPEGKYIKPKYKKYKDMTFEEKVMVRQMLRIKNAVPEYKAYPGSWYISRKVQELHRINQELIMTKRYNIHNKEDIKKALSEINEKQKVIKKAEKEQTLIKEEYSEILKDFNTVESFDSGREGISESDYEEALEKIKASGETLESIKDYLINAKENEIKASNELKNIRNQKKVLNRIKKKQEVKENRKEDTNEKIKDNNRNKKEREDRLNGRSRIN